MKNSKHYITFEIFTQLSSELQQQISGDPADGIHYRFFQVLTHALLFHFDAIFVKFHGDLGFLGKSKIGVAAHMGIESFSTYRARFTRKMPPNPCKYAAVWKTVMYEAMHKAF